jgi:hypothetical protein
VRRSSAFSAKRAELSDAPAAADDPGPVRTAEHNQPFFFESPGLRDDVIGHDLVALVPLVPEKGELPAHILE